MRYRDRPGQGATGATDVIEGRDMALFLHARRNGLLAALITSVVLTPGVASAQSRGQFNEWTIEPELNAYDKEGVWTMHFRFKAPRITSVEVPGRGRKIVWYMWYQVYNLTGEARPFVPEFELVTLDRNTVHTDEVLPTVQDHVRKIEDPSGRADIKNSVTIQHELIAVTKRDASYPRVVTGVAIWTDVYDRAPNTNKFSVFVSGLSDGLTKDDQGVLRSKTLRLDFTRVGDGRVGDSANSDIKYAENFAWIYRASAAIRAKEGIKGPLPEDKKDEGGEKKALPLKKDE